MAEQTDLFILQVEKHREHEPNVVFVLVPQALSNDFDILHRKWENSPLNNETYLPRWGKVRRVLNVEGVKQLKAYSEEVQPITFADWANMFVIQLEEHLEEENHLPADLEEQLVFFLGEFTLLRDGSIV